MDGNDISNVNHFNFNQFINQKLKSYSSNDRLHFIKAISIIIQHCHIQSSIHQLCIQLLKQIIDLNNNYCVRLRDDISFINYIIRHIINCEDNIMLTEYEILLQFLTININNITIRKIAEIKGLITMFIENIICDDQEIEDLQLRKLKILYNIMKCKDSHLIERYIKSLSNIKKFYKKLSRLMSNENMWIVLYSLFILIKLVINDEMQSQLFNGNNINIVFQLIFNLIIHGATTNTKMFEISVDLLSFMLCNDTMLEFLSNYPKFEKTIEKLLPLLLIFKDLHCRLMLRLLNILIESNKIQLIIIKILDKNRYISVILKLCLYHTNTDYYNDFNISLEAVKLMTIIIKSQYEINISSFLVSNCQLLPPLNTDNISLSLNESSSSSMLLDLECNQDFIKELKNMDWINDSCNVLFGHNEINGNNLMKKLCFMGHIDNYSLLSSAEKYIIHLIELLNIICKDSDIFKVQFCQLINIADLSYFLCPSKNKSSKNSEPNQVFLSVINFICCLNEHIVGISYLFKNSLCDSSIISAINNSLNSKSNSKDISNAIQFIYNVFNILSNEEQYDENNSSYISTLIQDKKTNKKKTRKKQKPRHYQQAKLSLMTNDNIDNNMDNIPLSQMSSPILYKLFCQKLLRFNKTHKINHSAFNQQTKQIEDLKKTVKTMKTELDEKNDEIEQIKSDFKRLQQELNQLNDHLMEIQDDNQTKQHIIKDKNHKIEQLKLEFNKEREIYLNENNKLKQESNQFKMEINGLVNKLKCVCKGYQNLKQESDDKINCMEHKLKQKEMDHRELNSKLVETQKLASMIQNLMSNKSDSK